MKQWWRSRRIRKLEDQLSDAEYELAAWGWSWRPSRERSEKERIEKLDAKLKRLLGETL